MSSLLPLPAQTADPKTLCSRLYTYRLSRESLRFSSELLSSFLASVFMYIILKTWAGHPIINILSVYFGSLIMNYSKTKDIIKGWFLCCNRDFVWSGEMKCRWPKICRVCTLSDTRCLVCTPSILYRVWCAPDFLPCFCCNFTHCQLRRSKHIKALGYDLFFTWIRGANTHFMFLILRVYF